MVLALWRFVSLLDQVSIAEAFAVSVPFLFLGGVAGGLLMIFGFVQARTTVYTITNRRIAMRIGAALTVTLNLPFTQIGSADLKLRRSGVGTIALDLLGDTRLSYLVCWPHVRPWVMRRTQPALRCIPDAERVAGLLADSAEARVSVPRVSDQPRPEAIAAE